MDYQEYSNNLRFIYPEYPCIDVTLKANNINVNIYMYDQNIEPITITNGDIISKYDGIVDTYYIYSGSSLVSKNLFVHKGDILIFSGTIN